MQSLPKHTILEFHPDTLQHVKKEYGLDKPGQMDAAIDILDDWVKKQAHFTKTDFPREYLERTIAFDKGSVEKAKLQMDNLFTMRTSMPYFFEKIDAEHDFENLHDYYVDGFLPKLTKDHFRIYAGRVLHVNGDVTRMFSLALKFGILLLEHVRAHDYCAGYVALLDYRCINPIEFVAKINISELQEMVKLVMEGYKMRVVGIHILTNSKTIEVLVRVLKQILNKKIGDRIYVHMTLDTLYNNLPKEILPEDLGGDLESLTDLKKKWVNVLSTEKNIEYLKEMNKSGVNEKLRNRSTNKNEEILGVSGSFKTLSID